MGKLIKVMLSILYTALLVYVVFFARRRERMPELSWAERVNLVPVVHQFKNYKTLNPKDPREERNFIVNIGGNILLFLPFPILMKAFGYRNDRRILLVAFLSSLSIEIIQYLFAIGVSDVDDVLLNMLGAYAGLFLFQLLPASLQSIVLNDHKEPSFH